MAILDSGGFGRNLGRRAGRVLVTLALLTAVLLALHATGVSELLASRLRLQRSFAGLGPWAAPAFVLLLALRPFTLVPGVWLAPVAALLFGPILGTALKAAGETLGAGLVFAAARHGLAPLLARRRRDPDARGLARRLGALLRERGFTTVLALRLNLLLPYDPLNLALGLSPVRPIPFLLGTLAGILPGTFCYVALSEAALAGTWTGMLVYGGGIALMLLASIPLLRVLRRPAD